MSKIVRRTLDFFELFADEKRPLSLSEISRGLGIPMSSCFDLIQSLQERGYIYELHNRGGYYPAVRLQDLASGIAQKDALVQALDAPLRGLRDRLDESVSLAQSIGRQVRYLLVYDPSHALRFTVRVGDLARRLHATSVGKALLATLPEEECAEVLAGLELDAMTPRTITDRGRLAEEIAETRRRGYAINREESVTTAVTYTGWFTWQRTPMFVTVAGPLFSMDAKGQAVVEGLLDTCRTLAAQPLGAQPSAGRDGK